MDKFDKVYDRKEYAASKWHPDYLNSLFGSEDVLPFWIADMDFKSPPALLESIKKRADFGILAYEYSPDSFFASLIKWISDHHHYELAKENIQASPSIGSSMGIAIDCLSETGDGVIIQPPVFMEYKNFIKNNQRKIVKNVLLEKDDVYSIDFEDLQKKAEDPRNKLLILCNPHNPIGQIWDMETLTKILAICKENDVYVLSDEVHGDIVYPGNVFNGTLAIDAKYHSHIISMYSPVKTFNLGGFTDSFMFIKDADLKDRISRSMKRFGLGKTNGIVRSALEAAFTNSSEWVDELIDYLFGNIQCIDALIKNNELPIKFNIPQASYQLWLDFRESGMDAAEVHTFLCEEAKLGMNAGFLFGHEGAGFTRMNIASPRSVVEEGMMRMVKAFKNKIPS